MSTLQLKTDCAGDGGFVLSLDCELPGSGVTAICGPSGSGKTTLLECIAGLRHPGPGAQLRFNGNDWCGEGSGTPPWHRGVGYVFSDAQGTGPYPELRQKWRPRQTDFLASERNVGIGNTQIQIRLHSDFHSPDEAYGCRGRPFSAAGPA